MSINFVNWPNKVLLFGDAFGDWAFCPFSFPTYRKGDKHNAWHSAFQKAMQHPAVLHFWQQLTGMPSWVTAYDPSWSWLRPGDYYGLHADDAQVFGIIPKGKLWICDGRRSDIWQWPSIWWVPGSLMASFEYVEKLWHDPNLKMKDHQMVLSGCFRVVSGKARGRSKIPVVWRQVGGARWSTDLVWPW